MKRMLVIGIIILFIGMSVVSSTGNIVKDTYNMGIKNSVSPSFGSDKKFYAVDCTGYPSNSMFIWFNPKDPGTFHDIGRWPNTIYPEGGTFVRDVWWVCDTNGNLFKVDEDTGEYETVGSAGTGELVDIAWDHVTETLWGISTKNYYKLDLNTGKATLVKINLNIYQLSITADLNGYLYVLGLNQSIVEIYSIDTTTYDCNLVCKFGETLYIWKISYEKNEGVMWGSAFDYTSFEGELWRIDIDNCSASFVGTFQNGAQTACLSIPYNGTGSRPVANFHWSPPIPAPEETVTFDATNSYDPDGNITLYEWDWDNDGTYDESHTNPTTTHSWAAEGHYQVTLRVTDNVKIKGKKTKTIIIDNEPPGPPTIDGPTSGKPDVEYTYTFVSIDPNDQDVKYYIDWGDGDKGWTEEYYNSGEAIQFSHTWKNKGKYTIISQAMDSQGYKSSYSTLDVRMPRDKIIVNSLFIWFLERFPLLERLISIFGRNIE